jgi:hypothetical protein
MSTLQDLPVEIVVDILYRTSPSSLQHLTLVNKHWYSLLKKEHDIVQEMEECSLVGHQLSIAARNGNLWLVQFLMDKCDEMWKQNIGEDSRKNRKIGLVHKIPFKELFPYERTAAKIQEERFELIERGLDAWNWGMAGAAAGGHLDLVKLFIARGANDWDWGLVGAVSGGHLEIVELFIEKGCMCDLTNLRMAASPHPHIIQFLKECFSPLDYPVY